MPRQQKIRRAGFSTAEVAMSALIVGILMAVALDCTGAAARSQVANGDTARASLIVAGLMAEIMELPYEEPDVTPVFGPETGETGTTRALFDDVDDYHGWSSSPKKKDGTDVLNGTGLTTTVQVVYANPNDLSTGASAGGSTDCKRVTVSVSRGSTVVTSLTAVVAR